MSAPEEEAAAAAASSGVLAWPSDDGRSRPRGHPFLLKASSRSNLSGSKTNKGEKKKKAKETVQSDFGLKGIRLKSRDLPCGKDRPVRGKDNVLSCGWPSDHCRRHGRRRRRMILRPLLLLPSRGHDDPPPAPPFCERAFSERSACRPRDARSLPTSPVSPDSPPLPPREGRTMKARRPPRRRPPLRFSE